MVWPKRIDRGVPREYMLDNLYQRFAGFQQNPNDFKNFHEESNWVCGYAIPPFQRPVVWDEDRMVKFVESAILGLHLGTWTYNSTMALDTHVIDNEGKEIWKADLWLLDGLQRLTALERFWNNEYPVFDLFWSDVELKTQRRFLTQSFPAFELSIVDEQILREVYDRLNFGGIPHTEEQRAVSKL